MSDREEKEVPSLHQQNGMVVPIAEWARAIAIIAAREAVREHLIMCNPQAMGERVRKLEDLKFKIIGICMGVSGIVALVINILVILNR